MQPTSDHAPSDRAACHEPARDDRLDDRPAGHVRPEPVHRDRTIALGPDAELERVAGGGLPDLVGIDAMPVRSLARREQVEDRAGRRPRPADRLRPPRLDVPATLRMRPHPERGDDVGSFHPCSVGHRSASGPARPGRIGVADPDALASHCGTSRRRADATFRGGSMSLLLVPQEVGLDRVELWVGALDEPDIDPAALSVGLAIPAAPAPTPIGAWDGVVSAGRRSIRFRRLVIDGLLPRGRYRFELRLDGRVVSDAVATTLPERLPSLDERPFTIMLGSCFAQGGRRGGQCRPGLRPAPGRRPAGHQDPVRRPGLPGPADPRVPRPHPHPRRACASGTSRTTRAPGTRPAGSASSCGRAGRISARTTTTSGTTPRMPRSSPATPGPRTAGPTGATRPGRCTTPSSARSIAPRRRFTVGDLSVFVADTRLDRTEGTDAFATDAQLERDRDLDPRARADPAASSSASSCSPAGRAGRVAGWTTGLADFGPYRRLAEALAVGRALGRRS